MSEDFQLPEQPSFSNLVVVLCVNWTDLCIGSSVDYTALIFSCNNCLDGSARYRYASVLYFIWSC